MIRLRYSTSLLMFFIGILTLPGCEFYPQDEYEEQYVVEAYLTAGETIDDVLLSTTAPFEEEYKFEDFAVSGAEIAIFELNDEGNRARTIPMVDQGNGVYKAGMDVTARPLHDYELEVITPEHDTLRAFTTVPDTFSVARVVRDETVFQSDEQIEVDLTLSKYPGRQNIYIFSTLALDTENYPMTPLYDTEDEEDREIAKQIRSNIVTEGNYDINDDKTITLTYPWLAVAWFGPNRVTVYAIDDNTYDFFRSQDIQLGGNTQAPGQIENVITHIEGGTGLFGASAGASFDFYVRMPEGF